MTPAEALARMIEAADGDDAGIFNDVAIDSGATRPAADAMLANRYGEAMSALIEAAVRVGSGELSAWQRDGEATLQQRDGRAVFDLLDAVRAWKALGDET